MRDAAVYYTWEPPDSGVSIGISFNAIEKIRALVAAKVEAGDKRGTEAGGLLLGQAAPGQGIGVTIDGFEELPSEHRRGPSFVLSERDKHVLERRLKARRNLEVVGYFRSHTRPGLYMDQDDQAVASRYFSSPQAVFLLIRPVSSGDQTAGFFYWEDGEIRRSSTRLAFPFDPAALGWAPAPSKPVTETETALAPVEVPAVPRQPAPARAATPPRAWTVPRVRVRLSPAIVTSLAVAGLLAAAGLGSGIVIRSLTEPRPPALQLSAQRNANDIVLSWNTKAVRNAPGGTLVISDGGAEKRFELNARALNAGRLVYATDSPDTEVRLEVDGRRPAGESLRIISSFARRTEPAAPLAPLPPVRERIEADPDPGLTATREVVRKPPPVSRSAGTLASRVPARLDHTGTADRASSRTGGNPILLDPPDLAAAAAVAPPPVLHAAPSRPRPGLNTPADVSIEPAPPSGFRRVVGRIPGLRRLQKNSYKAGEAFVPARAVRRLNPSAAPLEEEAPVDVRLIVDKEGRIASKSLVRSPDPALGELAMNALDHWEFEPARLNDKPTESELLVHFRFGAKQ